MDKIELELIRDALLYIWLSMDKDDCYHGIIESKIKHLSAIIKDKEIDVRAIEESK